MPLGNIDKILIIQLGDLGDVVWTYPTIVAINRKYPQAKISLLLREGRGGLFDENPLLSRILEVVRCQKISLHSLFKQLRFFQELRREHFDIVINLRGDERGAFLTRITGAPRRLALFYENLPLWRNLMFTHLPSPPPPREGPTLGPAEQSLAVVRPFGMDINGVLPEFPIPGVVRVRVQALLDKEGLNYRSPWVTISPYSRWAYKEWEQKKWIKIINWMWDQFEIASAIIGSSDDRSKADELLDGCRGTVFNLAGKTSLSELAGVIRLSFLHIGVDTAGPHIAAAVGVPTITIYGPSFGEGWAHPGRQHRIVFSKRDCFPCRKIGCDNKGWSRCLDELAVEQVERVIGETINGLKLKSGIQ